MNDNEQYNKSEEVMTCDNCGSPVVQSEVDDNEGKCPNCKEVFQPFNCSS